VVFTTKNACYFRRKKHLRRLWGFDVLKWCQKVEILKIMIFRKPWFLCAISGIEEFIDQVDELIYRWLQLELNDEIDFHIKNDFVIDKLIIIEIHLTDEFINEINEIHLTDVFIIEINKIHLTDELSVKSMRFPISYWQRACPLQQLLLRGKSCT